VKLRKKLLSFLLFLVCLEIILRISGIYTTYLERVTGQYFYFYRQKKPTWFHTYVPDLMYESIQPEFHYSYRCNDIGHREIDFKQFKQDTSDIKILCLGDSFTEGDGTCYDSTWVKFFERRIQLTTNKTVKLYNAGVNGSDVFFNNTMLVNKLVESNPDLVIECVNISDIHDYIWRGGLERFNPDGTTSYKVGPSWEPLFKYSHVFRAFIQTIINYDQNLVWRVTKKEQELSALDSVFAQIARNSEWCNQNNIKYLVIYHPTPHQIKQEFHYSEVFENKIQLLPYAVSTYNQTHDTINKENLVNYSWPINGHWNSKGYLLMGNLIFDQISKRQEFTYLFQ
jgi:lysophospholipase L1-like esterase